MKDSTRQIIIRILSIELSRGATDIFLYEERIPGYVDGDTISWYLFDLDLEFQQKRELLETLSKSLAIPIQYEELVYPYRDKDINYISYSVSCTMDHLVSCLVPNKVGHLLFSPNSLLRSKVAELYK